MFKENEIAESVAVAVIAVRTTLSNLRIWGGISIGDG